MLHSDCNSSSDESSPLMMSPWPWNGALVGSLRRSEGHVYSLAAKDGLLYTGSDGNNIRVWRDMQEVDAFRSSSGFVKAIAVSGEKIFTGHQDGRIRVWKINGGQIATLPTFFSVLKASMRPKNYVRVKRKRREVWIKHADAVSSLSMDEESGLLYSASWDGTFKVWQIHSSKCIDSVTAHDDAVNAVAAGGSGLVYTGSADGTVRVWRREREGRHSLWRTLLKQESAVTALAVGSVVYCGSSDGMLNFWEVDKDKDISHRGSLRGHHLAVLCLAAAGNLVISGSADMTLCVWRRDGLDHTCLTLLTGHTGPVKCVAVEADDGGWEWDRKWKVYSGSLDNSVKVWSVSDKMSLHQQNTCFDLELHH